MSDWHPRRFLGALRAIDSEASSARGLPIGYTRPAIVLCTVAVCLFLIHYLKFDRVLGQFAAFVSIDVLHDYRFAIARENKLDGVIETEYKVGSGLLERVTEEQQTTASPSNCVNLYLEVDNSAMTYMLINAVRELAEQNAALTKKVEALTELVNSTSLAPNEE